MHAGLTPSSLELDSRHVCRLETAANPSNKPTGFCLGRRNRLFFFFLQLLFSSVLDFAVHGKCPWNQGGWGGVRVRAHVHVCV